MYLINLTLAVKIKSLNSTTEATDFWGFAFHCSVPHPKKEKKGLVQMIEQNTVKELVIIEKLSGNHRTSWIQNSAYI